MLSIKNVCLVYDMAALYGLSKLMQSCCYFMDRHAGDVIQHESFSNLSRDSLRAIISRFVPKPSLCKYFQTFGNKERFDKEQIGVKELFSVTNCQFTS